MGATVRLALVLAQASPGAPTLQQDGANLQVDVYVPATGQTRTVTAQIDSGSTDTGASAALLEGMGAPVVGSMPIGTPSGDVTDEIYAADLLYQGVNLTANLPLRGILGETLPAPVQALIGRDVLENYDFSYAGPQGAWTLSGQELAPVPPLATRVWAGLGLMALGAAVLLAAEGIERHESRRRGGYGGGKVA